MKKKRKVKDFIQTIFYKLFPTLRAWVIFYCMLIFLVVLIAVEGTENVLIVGFATLYLLLEWLKYNEKETKS